MLRVFFYFSISLFLLSTTLLSSRSYGELLTKTPLDSGLEHYKSGNYSKALADWRTLLEQQNYGRSHELLFNLAITEFKLEDYGSALAHLRTAQVINPFSLKIYKTMGLFTKSIAEKEFYHVESEPFAKIAFARIPKSFLIGMFLLLVVSGTLTAIKRRSEDISFFTYLKPYLVILSLSTLPVGLIYVQNKVRSETYATLIGKTSVVIYTSHTSKAPELGTLQVGDAFQVVRQEQRESQDWLAISTTGIPLGWIKADAYQIHRSPDLISYRRDPVNIDQKAPRN